MTLKIKIVEAIIFHNKTASKENRLNRPKLAKLAGVTTRSFFDWERGISKPLFVNIVAIHDITGFPIDQLYVKE